MWTVGAAGDEEVEHQAARTTDHTQASTHADWRAGGQAGAHARTQARIRARTLSLSLSLSLSFSPSLSPPLPSLLPLAIVAYSHGANFFVFLFSSHSYDRIVLEVSQNLLYARDHLPIVLSRRLLDVKDNPNPSCDMV